MAPSSPVRDYRLGHHLQELASLVPERAQGKAAVVAFISDRAFPYFKGGAEKRYWEVARRLVQSGHTVRFYTGQWPGMPKEITVDGITLRCTFRVRRFYVNGRKSIRESIAYAVSLLPYLLAENYDLIECEQFPLLSLFPAKVASSTRKKPLVSTWHEVWGEGAWIRYLGRKGSIGAWIERIGALLPDRIISVSHRTTSRLVQMLGVDAARISTIPNGLDLPLLRSIKSSPAQSDLIFVGRLLEHKQVQMLLEVVSLLRGRRPGIKCLIVGDGPEREALERLARASGVDDNVSFLGRIHDDDQVYSLLKSSRVLVHPSLREGFGIAVVEANACGIPALVIEYPDNAAQDLIEPGYNGYVCNPDPADLAERALQILDEPPRKYLFSCLRAASQFDWDRVARQIAGIYDALLPDGPKQVSPAFDPAFQVSFGARPVRRQSTIVR